MTNNPIFRGAATALITPLNENGVDYERLGSVIDWQIKQGINALVIAGTTGEGSTLSDEEHRAVLKYSTDRVAGRVPVIAGTGSNDTAHCIDMCREAQQLGADGLLLVTPYYNKTSQRGLIAHYTKVAASTDLPMILYNVPSRTGVNIAPETMATLYNTADNIVGIKEASGNISAVAKIAALCDAPIYSGNDDQIVPILSMGGAGVISVLSNIVPQVVHDICAKWFAGDVNGSRDLQLQYLDLANALFTDVNPIPVKAAMNKMGMDVGECRLPLYPMEETALAALEAVMQRHGLCN